MTDLELVLLRHLCLQQFETLFKVLFAFAFDQVLFITISHDSKASVSLQVGVGPDHHNLAVGYCYLGRLMRSVQDWKDVNHVATANQHAGMLSFDCYSRNCLFKVAGFTGDELVVSFLLNLTVSFHLQSVFYIWRAELGQGVNQMRLALDVFIHYKNECAALLAACGSWPGSRNPV